jgi:inner membrane protein
MRNISEINSFVFLSRPYLIASMSIILLLAFYTQSLFKRWLNMFVFISMLTVFYIFVFVITKEQDYALLIGSVGLFIALAATMFATKKIDWYNGES